MAEDDECRAGIDRALAVGAGDSDRDVVETVAVDVAGRSDAPAGMVERQRALDREALVRTERAEVDIAEAAGMAEHDIGLAGIIIGVADSGIDRADDEVAEAVAVDVARRGDAEACEVAGVRAGDREARRAERAELDVSLRPAMAEDHIGLACIRPPAWAVGISGADYDVGEAIAVDVAGRGDAAPGMIAGGGGVNREAGGGIERFQIDRREGSAMAEDQPGAAGILAAGIGVRRADQEIVIAVTIEIAGGGHAPSGTAAGRSSGDDEALAARHRAEIDRAGQAALPEQDVDE